MMFGTTKNNTVDEMTSASQLVCGSLNGGPVNYLYVPNRLKTVKLVNSVYIKQLNLPHQADSSIVSFDSFRT